MWKWGSEDALAKKTGIYEVRFYSLAGTILVAEIILVLRKYVIT